MTFSIIVINIAVYFIQIIFHPTITIELAFRSIYLTAEQFPQLYTLFSSMFLHSTVDPLHIIFNMFYFILIAPSFEDRVGAKKFLLIFLLTGVCAAIFHVFLSPAFSSDPMFSYRGMIGASGAISGILGAYAFSFPRDRVFFPVIFIVRIPILVAGLIYLFIQTIFVFGGESNIAYLAHIGGFLSGIVIAAILIRRKGPGLFETTDTKNVYYDSYTPQKPIKIDFNELKKLAATDELKFILKKIENENVPQVQAIWLEHFFEKTQCPKCGRKLGHLDRKVSCIKCDFKTKF
jgi:membrane associated rhomboid family serine protease